MTKELAESKFASVELYEHQKRAIAALLAHKSVLLMTPTGSGKSRCFQVYTKTTKKQTLVISPLISLMDEQEQKAKELGFSVGRLHSGVDPRQQWVTLAKYLPGKIEILYASPEQVFRRQVQQILQNKPPGIVVIDEAHCISTWGRQFRPAYRRLGEFCKSLGGIPILAMTATLRNPRQGASRDRRRNPYISFRIARRGANGQCKDILNVEASYFYSNVGL